MPGASQTVAHPSHRWAQRSARWLSWVLGAGAVVLVIYFALHASEEQEVAQLMREAQPAWLAVAFLLQALTYWAQGESWRVVTRAARAPLPLGRAVRLSLAKLFIDQVLPSTGISGTVVVARALMTTGLSASLVMASVLVDFAGFHVAEDVGLLAAVLIAVALKKAQWGVVIGSAIFFVISGAQAVAVVWLSGKRSVPSWLERIGVLRRGVEYLEGSDPKLMRNPVLLTKCSAWQVLILALDASTMWALIRSMGGHPHWSGVFASFMLSTVLRTLSITPGGLGAFEAASTFTLKLAGVSLPVALSATLLFRALSFWLPMLPGLWFARPLRHPKA